MPLPLIPLLAAALPALLGGGAAIAGTAMQNASAKKRAQEQMDFQERMSSTSYQRSMEDMRQSGLNPMLAYAQGGASSPGGAMPDTQNVLGSAVSSAIAGQRLGEEVKSMREQRNLTRNQANVARTQAGLNQMHTNIGAAELEGVRLANAHSAASLPRAQFEAWMDRSTLGKVGMGADRVRDTLLPWLMLGRQGGPIGRPFGSGGSSIRGRY